jgi:glycosyltransferase involved in cell wall biosynthesis
MDISLVIPCYNEGPYLEKNLKEIYALLSFLRADFEMIIIDDKSKNDTLGRIMNFVKENGNTQLLRHDVNQGRGYTVTEGIRKAKGKVVGFIDIDLEVASQNIIPLVLKVLEGYDVALGKRIYKIKSNLRWILSKGYASLVHATCKTPFLDTETGCKFFNREKILPVLDETEDPHWFWDTEIVTRSYYKGLKIAEVPVLFIRENQKYSTVKFFRDTLYYFKQLLRFRNVIKYYRGKNRSH